MSANPPVTPEYLEEWRRRAHGSPLYRHLVGLIARDHELLRVINRVEHRPQPNMMLGAVQLLLMTGANSPLREFYPSLADDPRPMEEVERPFSDFVEEHEEEIVQIGRTRYTQTNECKRCAALLPAVWETLLPRFHLVEIGASAGLNLAMDKYRYRWGDLDWGPESPVMLEADLRGGSIRPREIEILSRIGLDLNPVDPVDPEDRAWLLALIWPEHHERRERLERALDVAASVPKELIAGSAIETLPRVLAELPESEPVIVMNSMVLIQLRGPQREELYRVISRAAEMRTIRRVSFEILAAGDEWVTIASDRGAGLAQIGQAHPHGEWVELYALP